MNRRDPSGMRRYEDRQAQDMRAIVSRCIKRTVRDTTAGATPSDIEGIIDRQVSSAEKELLEVSSRFTRTSEEMAIIKSQKTIDSRTHTQVGISIGAVGLPKDIRQMISNNVILDVQSVAADLRKQMSRVISEGISAGYSLDKIRDAVSDSTGELPNRAETIARTTIMKAFGETAKNRYVQAGADTISIFPTDDSRLCEVCMRAAVSPSGDLIEYTPGRAPALPLHPNCRCTYIPNYADSKKILLD